MSQEGPTRIRLAVVGTGVFGTTHLRNLNSVAGVEVVGVADIDPVRARHAARTYGVDRWAVDAVELMAQVRPDGVVVATPGSAHRDIAVAALESGVHALIEKPVAMTVTDIDAIAAAATSGDALVLPGHVLRFSKGHRQIAKAVQSGVVGSVMSITSRRYRDNHHLTSYPDIDPVLLTMIHDIDLALWILHDLPQQVWATRSSSPPTYGETRMMAATPSGATWCLATAWTFDSSSVPPDRVEVVGERGAVVWEANRGFIEEGPASIQSDVADTEDEMVTRELNHFVECISRGTPSDVVTLEDARVGLSIAESVLTSLRTGSSVHL